MLRSAYRQLFRLQKKLIKLGSISRKQSGTSHTDLPDNVDAIVIGGGVIGCSTLYHLAKYGIRKAILLERHKLTSGTTWHTAGLYWSLRPSDIEVEMLAYNKRLITETLPQETGMEVGWTNNGGLFIASTKERLDEYKRMYSLAPIYGIEAHLLDPKETKKLYPPMNVEDVYGAMYSTGDGTIDPSSLCTALAKGAKNYGANIFEDCPVEEILTKTDDVGIKKAIGVRIRSGQMIKSDIVLNCAGAWAPKLVLPLGVSLPTVAIHHAYVTTERIGDHVRGLPNIRDHDSAIYVGTRGDALSFGGYELNPVFWEEVKDDFVFGLFDFDWKRFGVHVEKAVNRIPILKTTGIKSSICGPMSFTPDHKPLMGETVEIKGLFVACGMELGMMMGGAYGQQAAHWAIKGRPEKHLFQYDIRRFNPRVVNRRQWLTVSGFSLAREFELAIFLKTWLGTSARIRITVEKLHEAVYTMYQIHWPREEPLAGRNQLKSPFHEALQLEGCLFQERHGWERPGWFSDDTKPAPVLPYDYYGSYGPEKTPRHENYSYEKRMKGDHSWQLPLHSEVIRKECEVVRTAVGMIDMSSMGKFYLTGADADAAVDYIFTDNISTNPVGSTRYTCTLNQVGGVEAIVTVSTLDCNPIPSIPISTDGRKGYYIVSDCASQTHVLSHVQSVIADQRFKVDMINCTHEIGILSLQGPNSRKILQRLSKEDFSGDRFPSFTHKPLAIHGHQCHAFGLPLVNDVGYECHIPKESCMAVYNAFHQAGQEFGLKNVGYRALDSLLAENGFHIWDSDVRFTDTPFEAGLDDMCSSLKTNTRFLGRKALLQRSQGLKKRVACFIVESEKPLWGLEAIYRNDQIVGMVRRADYSYAISKPLVFGLLSRNDGGILDETWMKYEKNCYDAFG